VIKRSHLVRLRDILETGKALEQLVAVAKRDVALPPEIARYGRCSG